MERVSTLRAGRIARLALVAGLLAVPAAAAAGTGEIVDASSTYETLMGLLEQGADSPVVGARDLDQVPLFELGSLAPGLHYLYSGRHAQPQRIERASKLVVLIHGVDEPGLNWDAAVRLLARQPGLIVFFFVWTKWNRPHSLEYWIGHDVSALARVFAGKLPEMEVVAHSAGGVLLLQSLCRPEVSRLCAYDPAQHFGMKVHFHTLASPLGGWGMHATSMASAMAGAVTAHVGSEVQFYDILPDIDLTVWYTAYEKDGVLKPQAGRDMRFPVFVGQGPEVKKRALPDCTHDAAILQGVVRIFGLEPPRRLPGAGPWKLIYQDEGQKIRPQLQSDDNEWKPVPR